MEEEVAARDGWGEGTQEAAERGPSFVPTSEADMHGNRYGEGVSDERLRRWRWRRKRTLWGEEQAVQGEGGEGLGAEGGRARWVEGFARQQARLLQGAERETVEEGSGEGAFTLGVLGTQRLLVLRMNPFMGFANRVWAVCSAMIMAVITERGLLVDWPADDVVRRVAGEMYLMPAMECLVSPPHVITLQALMSRYSQGTVASAAAAAGFAGPLLQTAPP